jgi:excisionase family DNA binding protein
MMPGFTANTATVRRPLRTPHDRLATPATRRGLRAGPARARAVRCRFASKPGGREPIRFLYLESGGRAALTADRPEHKETPLHSRLNLHPLPTVAAATGMVPPMSDFIFRPDWQAMASAEGIPLPGMPATPLGEFLTPREVADITGLHPAVIRREIDRGNLPASKLASRLRIRRADFEAWVQRGKVKS